MRWEYTLDAKTVHGPKSNQPPLPHPPPPGGFWFANPPDMFLKGGMKTNPEDVTFPPEMLSICIFTQPVFLQVVHTALKHDHNRTHIKMLKKIRSSITIYIHNIHSRHLVTLMTPRGQFQSNTANALKSACGSPIRIWLC